VPPWSVLCKRLIESFQDPLSALDAHVGKTVFQRVFVNNPSGRTKILVTHALHFLPQVDYIYTISDGQIMERGTYAELIANRGVLSEFVQQFGSKQQEEEKEGAAGIASEVEVEKEWKADGDPNAVTALKEQYEKGKTIMQEEERNVGAVNREVYKTYLAAGNGYILIPSFFLSLLLLQGVQVMAGYWLVFWQEQRFNQPAGFYVCDCLSFSQSCSPQRISSDGHLCHFRSLPDHHVLCHRRDHRTLHVLCIEISPS